jgi:hypothetical protein
MSYARRHTGVAIPVDALGKKACGGVQHRACVEQDQYELRAISKKLAEEAPERRLDVERRREVSMPSAVVKVDRSRTRR